MPAQINRLSARTVATITKPGRHADGGNLYLNVTASGARSWVFLYKYEGRQREMGLGNARDVSLAKAREAAAAKRQALADGVDPMAARERARVVPTFGEAADAYIDDLEAGWRNEKHRGQWRQTLKTHAGALRSISVDKISTDDIVKALRPIWTTKAETASRIRGRIEAVLARSIAKGDRAGDNPARWRGHLEQLLPPRRRLTRGHHPAMPASDVAAFVSRLRASEGMAARALEFAILTAGRSGEVLGARWDEFDAERKIWTIPGDRMKAGKEHRVPLSQSARAVVRALEKVRTSDFVFPGSSSSKPLSGMAMTMMLRRFKVEGVTVHGFRSTFKDWASESTSLPNIVSEMALAHTIKSGTERAYRRGDLFDKRAKLMEAWAAYCEPRAGGKVIPMKKAGAG